jgi:RecJ-like exonuclease
MDQERVMKESSPNQSESQSEEVIDLNFSLSNKMLKIKGKNMEKNCKCQFYLNNGTIMQLESCKLTNGTCIKCNCTITCYHCNRIIGKTRYKTGDIYLSAACLKKYEKSDKYDPSLSIDKVDESAELSKETKDRIQTLLYESKNLNQLWYGPTDQTILHSLLIENRELCQILELYRYHFIIPKQITIFRFL